MYTYTSDLTNICIKGLMVYTRYCYIEEWERQKGIISWNDKLRKSIRSGSS